MATHRATFDVTCDGAGLQMHGQGYDDASLKLPTALTRHAQLISVTVDVSDAAQTVPQVSISSLVDVSQDTDNDGDETVRLGDQLFFVDLGDPETHTLVGYPSEDGIYEIPVAQDSTRQSLADVLAALNLGITTQSLIGGSFLRTKQVRCEVFGGAADTYTVNMYYETAGDYRF